MIATIIYLSVVAVLIVYLIKYGWPEGRMTKAAKGYNKALIEVNDDTEYMSNLTKSMVDAANSTVKIMNAVDLSQKVKWRFEKESPTFGRYFVSFYNPIFDEYWYLPSDDAYFQGEWSLNNKCGYGAYESRKVTIRYEEIQSWPNQFKNLSDIEIYLSKIAFKYRQYAEREERELALPNIIEK